MFLISKIISTIILPPGFILGLMVLFLVVFWKKWFNQGSFFFSFYLLIIIIFGLLSSEPVSEKLIYPLESFNIKRIENEPQEKAELIIVLGGGSIIKSGPSLHAELTSTTRDRVLEGLILQKERKLPLLFTGGNVLKGENAPGEADAVKNLFMRFGLDKDSYILEKKSRNTYENAVFSSRKTEKRKIVLITSAFHAKRSVRCFEKAGFKVLELRKVDFRIDEKKMTLLDFLPSMNAFQNSYTALHEYIGILYYRMRYGI